MTIERIAILGSTGSIGRSALSVVDENSDRYRVTVLCANTDVDGLYRQAIKYQPDYIAMSDSDSANALRDRLVRESVDIQVLAGADVICDLAAHENVDFVIAAIVGAAGLSSTMSAVVAGKKVLLANKEALVCSGRLFMQAVSDSNSTLLPLDSEHNAIFQCLDDKVSKEAIKRVVLTASGGPFRDKALSELASVTPEQACAHPNWSMGQKISVDSATMMNKGLELIEACWMFDVPESMIDIVIHPESIVHSMVEYRDGSILAQMGTPDMKIPIAHALAWPQRIVSGADKLNLFEKKLSFQKPDLAKYPCLQMALDVAKNMGAAPLIMNAANEVAVEHFLQGRLGFTDIAVLVEHTLQSLDLSEPKSIDEVIELDSYVRQRTLEPLSKLMK